jgi:SAM-dependent methyltransferase
VLTQRLPAELTGKWNHNTHYYPLALEAVPCRRALDVGCGDGLLLRLLAPHCNEVVGVDPWADLAVSATRDLANVEVRNGDFLETDLAAQSFDLVTSIAAIHHMDFDRALTKMASLVRPGGRLVVVSIADYSNRLDWALSGLAIPAHRYSAWRRGYWDHPAPVRDCELSYRQVRAAVGRILPGATYRRRLYWRYSITWTRLA